MNKPIHNNQNIKWGIMGLGKIARKFTEDLKNCPDCQLYAVASRTLEKAEDFAAMYNISHAYGNYESLCQDPEIDAIYIATPHAMHLKNALLCLSYGKPVLCEKPLGLNAEEVHTLKLASRKSETLLMEGLWTKFLPSFQFVEQQIKSKALGSIKSLECDFGFRPDYDPEHRLFNKDLGGGSLLDIGIYPVFLSYMLLGKPETITSEATFFKTGADSSVLMEFYYPGHVKAKLKSSLLEKTPTIAKIVCEEGIITMNSRFHEPCSISIDSQGEIATYDFPTDNYGYIYEIEHVNQLIREKKQESPLWSLNHSLELHLLMDKVKDKIDLHYT